MGEKKAEEEEEKKLKLMRCAFVSFYFAGHFAHYNVKTLWMAVWIEKTMASSRAQNQRNE